MKKNLKDLTVAQLRHLLQENDLPTSGIKAELVDRLAEKLGVQEVECPDDHLQQQIDGLRILMQSVLETVRTLSDATNRASSVAADIVDRQVHNESVRLIDSNHPVSSVSALANVVQHSVRDVAAILPEFDMSNGHQSSRQFIDKINSLRAMYNWSDNLILNAVPEKLKGHAKIWLDSQEVFHEWEQFERAFITGFPCDITVADIHIAMIDRSQGKFETNVDYYYSMLAKGRRGKLDDKSIIRHVINGLHDAGMRKTLKALTFEKCPDLLRALTNFENDKTYSTLAEPSRKTAVQAETPIDNKAKRGPVCYNCRERGHIANNCPKPKGSYCIRCNTKHPKELSEKCNR